MEGYDCVQESSPCSAQGLKDSWKQWGGAEKDDFIRASMGEKNGWVKLPPLSFRGMDLERVLNSSSRASAPIATTLKFTPMLAFPNLYPILPDPVLLLPRIIPKHTACT